MQNMTRRVTALFDERANAERAADALVDLGAVRHEISLLAHHRDEALTEHHHDSLVEPAREVGDEGAPLTTTDERHAMEGAAAGAAIGAAVGLTAGVMTLLVPGFGLMLAAGPLAWALGGAAGATAAGAVAGGVYGALEDLGIEETAARGYEDRLRSGATLLSARVPLLPEDQIRAVLVEHGADEVTFGPAPEVYAEEDVAPAVPAPTTFPPADPAMGPTLTPPPAGVAPVPPPPPYVRSDEEMLDEEEEPERSVGRRP